MNRVVLWTGRCFAAILTIICLSEYLNGGETASDTRMAVIVVVALVFSVLGFWQLYIAWHRDGFPGIPPSFRWVMALFLASMALFMCWAAWLVTFGTFRREISILMWYQLGMSSLYFLVRWITIDKPRQAGTGETGSAG